MLSPQLGMNYVQAPPRSAHHEPTGATIMNGACPRAKPDTLARSTQRELFPNSVSVSWYQQRGTNDGVVPCEPPFPGGDIATPAGRRRRRAGADAQVLNYVPRQVRRRRSKSFTTWIDALKQLRDPSHDTVRKAGSGRYGDVRSVSLLIHLGGAS